MRVRCLLFFVFVSLAPLPIQAKSRTVKQALAAFKQGMMGKEEALAQAQTLIDQALEEEQPTPSVRTWYYRGVIYEKQLRNTITSEQAPAQLAVVLAAYQQVLAHTAVRSQYHSFAAINLHGLWAYYLDRGRRYYEQEAFVEAIEQWTICQLIQPEEPDAYLYTGIAAHHEGNTALALQQYEAYLARGGRCPAVYRGMANLIAQTQGPMPAIAFLEKACQAYPFEKDLLEEQRQVYAQGGQIDELATRLQAHVARNPLDPVAHYQLGDWYAAQQDYTTACQQYEQAAALAPRALEPIREQGVLYYNQAVHDLQWLADVPKERLYYVQAVWKPSSTTRLYDPLLRQCLSLHALEPVLPRLYVRSQPGFFLAKVGGCIHPLPCFTASYTRFSICSRFSICLRPATLVPLSQLALLYEQKVARAFQRKKRKARKNSARNALQQAWVCFQKAYTINPRDALTLRCLHSLCSSLGKPKQASRLARIMKKYKIPFLALTARKEREYDVEETLRPWNDEVADDA